MAPEATGDGNGCSTMEAAQKKKKKHRKRKKSSSSAESVTSSLPGNGDDQDRRQLAGDGQEQEQQQRRKQRVVWTEELHDLFVKAYDTLGKDAVPKKILTMMNVDGITRDNVASHLQKHRLNLKREEQRRLDREDREQQPQLHAEASSQTPPPPLHPPHQPTAASSSLHPLPPQAPFVALNMSQLQIGQHILQTPAADCFSSNSAASNLFLHTHTPQVFRMVQPIQHRFMPPMEPTGVMWRKLVEEQEAGLEDATTKQAAAAASGGYNNPVLPRNNVVAQTLHMQASSQVVSVMNGEIMAPEANLKFEEEEIRRAQMQVAAKAKEMQMATKADQGQGRGAERDAAEMAAKAEEGQGRAAEAAGAATTAAASLNPPGSSIVGQFWKRDGTVVSWDFVGFPRYKTTDSRRVAGPADMRRRWP